MIKLITAALLTFLIVFTGASHSKVLMQGFYWDYPAGGVWWNTIKTKVPEWQAAGITDIWLPPAQKAQGGASSMGYDPYDYYDLGQYNQHGTVETRAGSYNELKSLIDTAHNYGMGVYADIVINHNSGGELEWNPYTNSNTWTKFEPLSGKFNRSYNDFHPNLDCSGDSGVFGGFPDLAHCKSYVQDWLWGRSDSVAKYYKNTLGFDGWRFDYVKGFGGWVIQEWVNAAGGFAIGEYWDSNKWTLNNWVNSTGNTASAFDFALYYAMDDAFDGNDLTKLVDAGLISINPMKSVTFVANHDTDIIWNKNMAYGYIFTHEGVPTLFYRDYEEWLDKDRLNNLIWIYNNLADGNTSTLYVDNDELIDQRNGQPGLVVYMNNSSGNKYRWVKTKWANTELKDYTGHLGYTKWTNSSGWVELGAPGNDYSVWAPK